MNSATGRLRTGWLITVIVGLLLAGAAQAALQQPERPASVRVELPDVARDLELLQSMKIDIEAVHDGWARAYLRPAEIEKLRRLGFELTVLPDEGLQGLARMSEEGVARGLAPGEVPAQYHDYASLTQDLQQIASDHADIVRLTSAGQSVQGRELWMVKISANPDVEEDEPQLLYIAAMHGDEVVGKEMCVNLINYLTDRYPLDPRVARLVDSTEIWILPSVNPDGTEAGQRYNAHSVDLNRDFPDWFEDPTNTPEGREPETAAVMAWTEEHNPILGGSFHGGTLVVNYPFDNNETGSSVFSPTPDPDQDAFHSISLSYAEHNPPMHNSSQFPDGVTNGAEWYAISGGVQDWSYCWYSHFLVTLEISNSDWPPGNQLPQFWEDNREAMLSYFERVFEGARGVVTDAESGTPLSAEVFIDDNPFPSLTDPDVGDYHRVAIPGTYSLTVTADGYESQTGQVTVLQGQTARFDVALQPLPTDLQPVSVHVDDGLGGNGWLDPGEDADLAVTLENLGRTATSVGATLVPTGWFSEILQGQASYPDIPAGDSAGCDPPCFWIEAAADVPAGYKLGFALQWNASEGAGTSDPFFLEVGAPTCQTTSATDVPQSILDFETTTSLVQVLSDEEIFEIRIPVNISHTYIGDLTVELISPSGTSVMLHDRSGGSAHDIIGTYGEDLVPAEPLSVLVGEPAAGTWRLLITDHAGSDTGNLDGWGVEVCGQSGTDPTPEMRLRDLEALPEGVRLRWWTYPGLDSYRVYRSNDPGEAAAFADVTVEDGDATDTIFLDASSEPLLFWLVTGVGPAGEGPLGHFDQ